MSKPSEPLLGICICYPSPGIIERIGSEWDWVWLDGQHGQIAGYETSLAMVRACNLVNRPAFLRVPSQDAGWLGLALDTGVDAVIVPQVDTPEQAKTLVRLAKFPPLGNRSFGGRRPIDRQGRSYVETANSQVKLVCQIESPEAVANVERIAAVPGVDGLFLGPDDLMLRWGLPMTHPADWGKLSHAVETVAKASKEQEKSCVCIGATEPALSLYRSLGVTHVVAGSDAGFLSEGTRKALEPIRRANSPERVRSAAY